MVNILTANACALLNYGFHFFVQLQVLVVLFLVLGIADSFLLFHPIIEWIANNGCNDVPDELSWQLEYLFLNRGERSEHVFSLLSICKDILNCQAFVLR